MTFRPAIGNIRHSFISSHHPHFCNVLPSLVVNVEVEDEDEDEDEDDDIFCSRSVYYSRGQPVHRHPDQIAKEKKIKEKVCLMSYIFNKFQNLSFCLFV
jgi:hypothetical protein